MCIDSMLDIFPVYAISCKNIHIIGVHSEDYFEINNKYIFYTLFINIHCFAVISIDNRI